jgi:hypothetical protein
MHIRPWQQRSLNWAAMFGSGSFGATHKAPMFNVIFSQNRDLNQIAT